MQDLSGQHLAALVPTSQSSGGEVHDNSLAMSAPGSPPISAPAPGAGQSPEVLPLPVMPTVASGISTVLPPGRPAGQPVDQPRDPVGRFGGVTVGTGRPAGNGWTFTVSESGESSQ
jgi:hypothetical protein